MVIQSGILMFILTLAILSVFHVPRTGQAVIQTRLTVMNPIDQQMFAAIDASADGKLSLKELAWFIKGKVAKHMNR